MATIPRSHTARIGQLRRALTACRVYSLADDFAGKAVDPGHAWNALLDHRGARLTDDGDGRYTVSVHANLWYELAADGCLPAGRGRRRPAVVADLPDARRRNKPWLPADDRDVTNGLVVADAFGKPACARHGAMNRVDPEQLIYRCQEMYCGVGARVIT